MKNKLLAIFLFTVTTASIAFYPFKDEGNVHTNMVTQHADNSDISVMKKNRIEVVFVLDTTGSMSGLIAAAKEKIWSIATTMASAQSSPEIKMGLVAYRDRGDEYVTRTINLSHDLDSMYARLMDLKAAGGGDGPESVNKALFDAVNKINWSKDKGVYKVVFLIGDAPPHMDYANEAQYPEVIKTAYQNGIIINAIQSGNSRATQDQWRHMARLGQGEYFKVGQSGDAIAVNTPYDKKMAVLSRRLDDTRMYYGSSAEKEKQRKKVMATRKLHTLASTATQARRAEFNVGKSGKHNRLGDNELINDVTNGMISLENIEKDHLPSAISTLSAKQQLIVIKEKSRLRQELIGKIKKLGDKRKKYITSKVAKSGKAESSLDEKLYKTIRQQAAKKGFEYKSDSAAY